MLVAIFVILLAAYTFSVVKISNMAGILDAASESAIILFAIVLATAMIIIIAIIAKRIEELNDENYKLNRRLITYECKYRNNGEDKF